MSHSFSHEKNVSTRSPASARMGHGLAKSAFSEKEKAEEVGRNTCSHASSDAELHVLDNSWKRYGVGYTPDRQGSGRLVKSLGKSNDLDMESSYSSVSEEEDDLHSSRTTSAKEAKTNNYTASQSPSTAGSSEFSNYPSDGNGSMLDFRNLTGGLRNKASSQKAYIRVHSANASSTSKYEGVDEPPSISQKQTIFVSDKSTASLGPHNQRPFNQASPIKVNKGSSAISNTPSDLGGDNEGDFSQFQNVGSHQGVLLSRSKSNTVMPDSSVLGAQSRPSQENSYSSAVESLPTTQTPAMSKPLGVGGNSTSREGSLKNPSHVHPKLPDYDTLAAQFKALRTNQRSL